MIKSNLMKVPPQTFATQPSDEGQTLRETVFNEPENNPGNFHPETFKMILFVQFVLLL